MKLVETDVLHIEVQIHGPAAGPSVLLLHGWPDAPRGWRVLAEALQRAGWRTITPALRGTGGTAFVSPETPRDAQASALAQDAVDLMDAMGSSRPRWSGTTGERARPTRSRPCFRTVSAR